jgi:hypothetical protein
MVNSPGTNARIIFCGYSYSVGGSRYSGLFGILAIFNEQERIKNKLSGAHLQIRYNPSNPATSFLVNIHDPLF